MEVTELKTLIRDAFRGVKLGGGLSLGQLKAVDNHRQGYSDRDFANLKFNDVTDDWEKLTVAILETCDCYAHLDPEGFRYYIPALCLAILDHYDSGSMRVIGTIGVLYPTKPFWESHMEMYSLLSKGQRESLAIFVNELPNFVELYGENRTCIERAFTKYWKDFLPRKAI